MGTPLVGQQTMETTNRMKRRGENDRDRRRDASARRTRPRIVYLLLFLPPLHPLLPQAFRLRRWRQFLRGGEAATAEEPMARAVWGGGPQMQWRSLRTTESLGSAVTQGRYQEGFSDGTPRNRRRPAREVEDRRQRRRGQRRVDMWVEEMKGRGKARTADRLRREIPGNSSSS